jgi:rsbT co-antagonist protein RsbR
MATKEELQKRIAELEATQARAEILYQISRGLNTARDEEELLQVLIQPARKAGVFTANLLYIGLNEAGQPEWAEIVAVWQREGTPVTPVGSRFYLPEFPFASLLLASQDEPHLIADAATDERVDETTRNLLAQSGVRAFVLIPLTQAGRWVGIFTLSWREPHKFSEQEMAVYNALIGLASPAVESRRLVGNLEQMVEERTAALRESEARFRDMALSTSDWMWEVDSQGRYTYCSEKVVDVLGYTVEEILNKTPFDLMPPNEAARIGEIFGEIVANKQPIVDLENWNVRKDGRKACLLTNGVPLLDQEDNLIGYRGVDKDITERKQVEEKLKELEHIVNHSPAVFFLWRAAEGWPVEFVSDNIEQFGYTPEDFYSGRVPYATIVHADDLERVAAEVTRYSQEEGRTEFTQAYRIITQSREVRWTDDRTWIRRDAEGNITHYQGIVLDVTEQKQAEAEREHLQQELIEAQKRAIQELSTPVIPIMERIIVMPLIGSIDSMRARDITRTLLAGVNQHRAKVVILDVTGVGIMDTGIVNHLNKTIQAARLKGAKTIVTGISDAVAEAIVDLGIDWGDIETLSDLQTGLVTALGSLGVTLSKA